MAAAALFPSLALIAGCASGITWPGCAAVCLSILPLLVTGASAAWWRRRERISFVAAIAAFACCGVALGAHACADALDPTVRRVVDPDGREPVLARLLLTEDAAFDDEVATLRADVVSIRIRGAWSAATGGVIVSVGGTAAGHHVAEWRRSRLLQAPVTFRRPSRYLNDGVADFERDAALGGISLLGSVKSALLVQVVRRGSIAAEFAADMRQYVRRTVRRRIAPHSALSAAIVSAVLIGDRSGLPDDVRKRLQAAGTYHVIAISGGNIAILTTCLFVVLFPLGLSGRRGTLLTLVLLVAYASVVTAGPSVWRATLVAAFYLVARVLDHRSAPWQAMAVAGGVLAACAPLDVRDAGFILTFGATAALLQMVRWTRRGPRALAWLASSIGASAAVEIVLLPVMAATFSRVTFAGLVLNLIAVPAMAVVQIAGLVVVCFDSLNLVASAAAWMAHLGAAAIVESARLVDVVRWLSFRVPPPTPVAIVAYYVGIGGIVLFRGVKRICAVGCAVAAGVVIVGAVRVDADVPGLRLTMVDVGQGDAVLVQLPGPHAVEIDTGGRPFGNGGFDIGERVLEPALWARGVLSLDALLLTHGDPDHIGGALPLIDDFRPQAVWQGIPVPRAASLQQVIGRALALRVPVAERHEPEEFRIGNARILVLHPPAADWERQRVRNDDSVVLEVVYGDVALLLTGDIGSDVEQRIAGRLIPARTRILKVAHHGSRTSTSPAFLDAWHPDIALISCGRGNPFGHPAPEVIARLEAIGARVYRTDLDGEITVETDGRRVDVRTFVQGARQ